MAELQDEEIFDYENFEEKRVDQSPQIDSQVYPDPPTDPDRAHPVGNDYYEGILFSDGLPKPVPDYFPPPPPTHETEEIDEEYEDVEVNDSCDVNNGKKFPDYENLPNGGTVKRTPHQQHQQQVSCDSDFLLKLNHFTIAKAA